MEHTPPRADERAAIIRLIKAHAKDCERRGARSLGHGYLALVSEIEDAMQHDRAHVEALESPPVKVPGCGAKLAYETIGPIRIHNGGVFKYLCPRCGKRGTNNGAALVCGGERERLLDKCGECAGSGGYDGSCFTCGGTGMVEEP